MTEDEMVGWHHQLNGHAAAAAAKSLQSCLTLFDPMNHSMPGLTVHHQLPEFTQTHVHWEKAMAPHSSTLAWKIPWAEEPGGLQSVGSRRVGHD